MEEQNRVDFSDTASRASWLTLADTLRRSVKHWGNRVAVASPDRLMTYRELHERTSRLANALEGLGINRGDRIAIISETRPEFAELYYAASKLGVCVVPLNLRLATDELAFALEDSEPKAFLYTEQFVNLVPKISRGAKSLKYRIAIGNNRAGAGDLDYAEFLQSGSPEDIRRDIDPESIHNFLYTSGTTGRPKGAMISERAAVARGMRIAYWFELHPDDAFLCWLPLFHCGGDESLYATIMTGGKFITVPSARMELMYRMMEQEHGTWLLLLPGVFQEFLFYPDRNKYDLSAFRFSGGYANLLSPDHVAEFTRTFNVPYMDAYGQTETSYLVAFGRSEPGERPTYRRWVPPMMYFRLVDDQMNDTPIGVPGEIVVRGPTVMSGYWKRPEANREAFVDSWLHTGDVLVQNEDGTLTYVDRKKYLIKTGGENVYPAEVENVIMQHPAVSECCVVGVPDPKWGEAVKACVVLKQGSSVDKYAIVDWCRNKIASYKKPRYVEFLQNHEIPRSQTGKILRSELAKRPITEEQMVLSKTEAQQVTVQ